MNLITPTTKDISDNIIAQLETSLNQSFSLLPKSFNRVLAKALSGLFILLYKYAGFTFLQIFVRTANFNETEINGVNLSPLTEWGRLVGVSDPVPAVSAELLIDIAVTDPVGSLPSGSALTNSDNGVTYLTQSAVLLDASIVQVVVKAVSDQTDTGGRGAIGNLEAGDVLSFASPLPNVDRDTVVVTQQVTGVDQESSELYRQRVLDRFQKPPQGGAYADYEQWGEEVAGISNAYPYTSDCPGQVEVFVEATVESSGDEDGIPTTAQLQAVKDSIELDVLGLASRRPAGAQVAVLPITRTDFEVRVLGINVDNIAQVQTDVESAIREYFLSREPFIVGLSVLPRRDRITVTGLSSVVEDIVTAAGGVFARVLVTQNSLNIVQYSLGQGEKAKTSSVTFT